MNEITEFQSENDPIKQLFFLDKSKEMSPSGDSNVVHRPGALKQQNKPFKTGRHRSQHEIKRSTKGFQFNSFI